MRLVPRAAAPRRQPYLRGERGLEVSMCMSRARPRTAQRAWQRCSAARNELAERASPSKRASQLVGAGVHAAVGQQADEVQRVAGEGGSDVLQAGRAGRKRG